MASEASVAPTARPATAMLSEATASAAGSISRSAAQIAAMVIAARVKIVAERSLIGTSRHAVRRGASMPRPSALTTISTRAASSTASITPWTLGSERS